MFEQWIVRWGTPVPAKDSRKQHDDLGFVSYRGGAGLGSTGAPQVGMVGCAMWLN
jgi:hypothetical protein